MAGNGVAGRKSADEEVACKVVAALEVPGMGEADKEVAGKVGTECEVAGKEGRD